MKLYASPTSPYVRKARAVAVELGLPLTLEMVAVHAIPSDYGRVNPVNRIPALELDDGTLVFDSRVICEYLDVQAGSRLLSASGPERWRVLKLQVLGDGLLDAGVPKLMELQRPEAHRSAHRLAECDRSIRQILDALEADPAGLEGVNLGTLSVGVGLGYLDFRFPADDWRATRPTLADWWAAFAERAAMRETVPRLPVVA